MRCILPLDRLDPFLDARLTQAERAQVAQVLERRIDRPRAGRLPHAAKPGSASSVSTSTSASSFRARSLPSSCRTASRPTSAHPSGRERARPRHGIRLPRDPARARLSRRRTSTPSDVSIGRAHGRATQRRRLRARRPDQPDPLRPLLEPVRKKLRPHHQQSAVRDERRDGEPCPPNTGTSRVSRSPAAKTVSMRCADPRGSAAFPESRRHARRRGRPQPRRGGARFPAAAVRLAARRRCRRTACSC